VVLIDAVRELRPQYEELYHLSSRTLSLFEPLLALPRPDLKAVVRVAKKV
jgi:hypothetical protein